MFNDLTMTVKSVLEQCPEARNSDTKLIYGVMRTMGVGRDEAFSSVIRKMLDGSLPAFASITRAKRKVVEICPELDADREIRQMRAEQEEMYKAYSRVKNI